jgi:hypothetical protein
MHSAIIAILGLALPFLALHGSIALFKLVHRITIDSAIPFVSAFNMVVLTMLFPWLIINDFVSTESASLLFHCMLVGMPIAMMIEVLAPKKQKATNAPRTL